VANSILVTGGVGFIGSHLVDRLLIQGEQVTVIDNFNNFYDPSIKRANIAPYLDHVAYTLVEDDLRDFDLVSRTFRSGRFDQIIHLAAMKVPVRMKPTQPGDVSRTYADITKAKCQLGFNPSISINNGLHYCMNWYLQQRGNS